MKALLDSRTLDFNQLGIYEKPKYENLQSRLTIKKAGKVVTVIATQVDKKDVLLETAKRKRKTGKREIDKKMLDYQVIENMARSLRRAYQTVLTKARLLKVDRMLTLTFKANVSMIANAQEALLHFFRLAKKRFGNFEYIATPERQKRGAWHFHIGLNRFYDWTSILAIWRLAIKKAEIEGGGGIFINKKIMAGKSNHVARYIAKYILKELKELKMENRTEFFNKKRFYCGRISEKVEKQKVYTNFQPNHWYMRDILYGIMAVITQFKVQMISKRDGLYDWKGQNMSIIEFEILEN